MSINVSSSSVLVFGGGINALGIVRNLGRQGVNVYSIVDRIDPVIFSRYCKGWYMIPKFSERKDVIKSFLSQFSHAVGKPVLVFLTDDISTINLSDLQYEIDDDCRFVAARSKISEIMILKSKFYESLLEHDIPHPRVIPAHSDYDIRNANKELSFPIFVRPCLSQEFEQVFRKKGFVVNTQSELEHYHRLVRKLGIDVILQEIIPGPDTNVFGISGAFDEKHRPLALFGYHRIRGWPPMFGNSSLMESVPMTNLTDLKKTVVDYLASLHYYGVMDAEFKFDPRDGVFKLLEINPRSWWQNSFPTKCGLNIIAKAYSHAIGSRSAYSEDYSVGVKWVNGFDDVRSSLFAGIIGSGDWIRSFSGVKDFAFFDLNDIGPLLTTSFCAVLPLVLQK